MTDNEELKMKVKMLDDKISDKLVSEYFDKPSLDTNKVNERIFGVPYIPVFCGTSDKNEFKKQVKTLVAKHNQAVPEIVKLHQEALKLQVRYDEALRKYTASVQQIKAVLIPQNTIDEELLSQQIDEFMEAKEAYNKAGVEIGELRDRINSLELPLNTLLYYLFGQPMPFSFSTPMDK